MKRRQRIALFGKGVIGGGVLGQGVPVLRNLAEGLCKEFDVVLYTLMPIDPTIKTGHLTVRSFSSKRIPVRIKSLLTFISFFRDHLESKFSVIQAISTSPAGRFAVWLAAVCRLPVIVVLTTEELVAMPEIGYGELLEPGLRKINQWVCKRATAVIVLTEFQKQIALRNLDEARAIHVVPLMIDAKRFPFRERILTFPVKFLHIAYFHPVKDQFTLFRVFAKIAENIDCLLTVVGDGFDIPVVRQMLLDLGISHKVIFTGPVRNEKLVPVFLDAHVLLQTSRYESQGVVVLESMASGVPVCGTSVGIISDLGNQYAVGVPVVDAETLALRTLELINNPEAYRKLQVKGREFVDQHPAEWSANQFIEIIRKII